LHNNLHYKVKNNGVFAYRFNHIKTNPTLLAYHSKGVAFDFREKESVKRTALDFVLR
jgi:hypothetical protein